MDERRLSISGRHIENVGGTIVASSLKGELTFRLMAVEDPSKEPELYAELCPDDGDWCLILRPAGQRSFLDYTLLPDGGIKLKVLSAEGKRS